MGWQLSPRSRDESYDVTLNKDHTRPDRSETRAQETSNKQNDDKHDRYHQRQEEGETRSEDRLGPAQDGTE